MIDTKVRDAELIEMQVREAGFPWEMLDPRVILGPEPRRDAAPSKMPVAVVQGIPGLGARAESELAASDITFLRAMFWSVESVDGVAQDRVHPNDSAVQAALLAAVLANAAAGAVRLEVEETVHQGFFTTSTKTKVRLEATGSEPTWPNRGLERSMIDALGAGRQATLEDVVSGWIGTESPDPQGQAAKRVTGQMVSRGVLVHRRVQHKALWVFEWTADHYMVPERTKAQLGLEPVLPGREQQWTQPLVYRAMEKDINQAFTRRTEVSDSYD